MVAPTEAVSPLAFGLSHAGEVDSAGGTLGFCFLLYPAESQEIYLAFKPNTPQGAHIGAQFSPSFPLVIPFALLLSSLRLSFDS